MLNRAYSILTLKTVDEDERILEGIATTPTPDRVGDVIESKGAQFRLPIPLLWQHRNDAPIGRVLGASVTDAGIRIRAQIEKNLLPEIDRSWALIKSGLVAGLSIGFKGLESEPINAKDPLFGGQRYKKWEWLELSAVTIPANSDATIQVVKALDAADLAASGDPPHPSGVSDTSRPKPQRRHAMKQKQTLSEQKSWYATERTTKVAALNALMPEDGTSLDEAAQQEFDGIEKEIEAIDGHLARIDRLERINAQAAVEVKATTPEIAALSRNGGHPVITVHDQKLPPGIGFARYAMAKAVSSLDHRYMPDVAKEMWPSDTRLRNFIETKGAVPAANTQNALWAGNLVYADNLVSEFAEYLRPMTIIGKFGTNGIPSLTQVPFNIRFNTQTTGGEAWWVGEGAPKPVTAFEFTAATMTWAKVANIAVLTQEQVRFSSPSTEAIVRDQLAAAIRQRIDIDFIDPAQAAVANVNPASITNGLTPLSSAGTSADNVRTDIQNILEQYILDNVDVSNLVLIMPNTLAMVLGLMVTSLNVRIFPDIGVAGGNLLGIPVITSQFAAFQSGQGNLVVAVNARDILLADDGAVDVRMSTEASLQMLSDPTNNSRTATATTMVSMFQTNSVALLAERFITWAKRRPGAVVYMDDVNWGSIGSPT